jgi:hypothetical protein
VTGEERGREQRDCAKAASGDAQTPRRQFAQRDRGGNPVETPREGQQDDQELGLARNIGIGIRHPKVPADVEKQARRTLYQAFRRGEASQRCSFVARYSAGGLASSACAM